MKRGSLYQPNGPNHLVTFAIAIIVGIIASAWLGQAADAAETKHPPVVRIEGNAFAAAEIPDDPTAAHLYADQVLYPQLVAATNAWTFDHPRDREGHPGEHAAKFDVKDRARARAMMEAFHEWERAMKKAGY